MRQGYDGTIRIDTKIDSDGLNKGVAEANKNLTGIGKAVQGIGKALAIGTIVAAVAGVAALGLAFKKVRKNISEVGTDIKKAVGRIGSFIKNVAGKIGSFIKNAAGSIANFTKAAVSKVFNFLMDYKEVQQVFDNLKVALSDAFRPLVTLVMPWINQIAQALTHVLNMVAQTIAALTGQEGYWKTVTSAAEASGDATKEAEGALAAFDNINVLKEENQGGGGGGGGGPAQEWVPFDNNTLNLMERFRDMFDDIDWEELGRTTSEGIIGVLTKAREAVQGFDFKQFGTDIGNGFNNIVSSINSFLTNIDFTEIGKQLGGLLSDSIKGIFDTGSGFLQEVDWQAVGDTIWLGLVSAFNSIKGFVEEFDWSGTVSSIFGFLGSAIGAAAALIVTLGTKIWEALKEAWNTTKEKWASFKDETGGDIWGGILEGIKTAATNIGTWIKEHVVQPLIDGFKKAFGIASPSTVMAEQGGYIIDGLKEGIANAWVNIEAWFTEKVLTPLKEWFGKAWEDIKAGAETAWTKITEVWQTVKYWFEAKVITPLDVIFTAVWLRIKSVVSSAWDGIKELWQGAKTWFTEHVTDPIQKAFEDAWNKIGEFMENPFEAIGTFVKDKLNGIIDFLNGLLRGVADGVNNTVGLINSISFKAPKWAVDWFGAPETIGFNLPSVSARQIPYLATGAVIPPNSEFLAILGDQRSGTNIEAPENLIRKIIREEMVGRNAFPDQAMVQTTVMLDSAVLQRAMKREQLRVGPSMLSRSGT